MKSGDEAIYYHRIQSCSVSPKSKIHVTIVKITDVKAKVTRIDNGSVMWVNKENITVIKTINTCDLPVARTSRSRSRSYTSLRGE